MLLDDLAGWDDATLHEPATDADLEACEAALGHPLPEALRALLVESDGVDEDYDLALVWPAERIGRDNRAFRTDEEYRRLYMGFDDLVFFGDAGNGDQFAMSLRGPQDVYVWNHEDDSRTWIASTPLDYLRRWLSGELEV